MNIIHARDANEATRKAGEHLSRLLDEYKGAPVLLLLSGGSSLRLLESADAGALGPRATIAMLDERAAPSEPRSPLQSRRNGERVDAGASNFAQFAATDFYRAARARGAAFLDTRLLSGEGVRELAERVNGALASWIAAHPDGTVIATFGIGPDGHTAGIMPFPEDPRKFDELFENPEQCAVGYDAGARNPHPLRVTANLPFLRSKVSEGITYAAGEGKREALARVLAEDGTLAETPARILREMKKVVLYTDIPL